MTDSASRGQALPEGVVELAALQNTVDKLLSYQVPAVTEPTITYSEHLLAVAAYARDFVDRIHAEETIKEVARRMWEADPEYPDNGYDDVHDLEREVGQVLASAAEVIGGDQ